MTTNNSFNFADKTAFIALYLDAARGRAEMQAELDAHDAYMSDICKAGLDKFGADVDGKKSLQLDLGDGNARGHIVVQRGDLYFIRARNSGRPVGSKNKTSKAASEPASAPQVDEPEIVTEENETAAEPAVTMAPESPKLSPFEQALLVAEQEERELAAAAKEVSTGLESDKVVEAILSTANAAFEALKEHSRSHSVAPQASTGE